jgi:hypothetical protein
MSTLVGYGGDPTMDIALALGVGLGVEPTSLRDG